MNMWIPFFTVD